MTASLSEKKAQILALTTGDHISTSRVLILFCGSHVAGKFLGECIFWNAVAKRSDRDSFYRTHKEWFDHCALTRNQVDSCRSLLEPHGIITTSLENVPGTEKTCLHYRINWDRFVEKFEEFESTGEPLNRLVSIRNWHKRNNSKGADPLLTVSTPANGQHPCQPLAPPLLTVSTPPANGQHPPLLTVSNASIYRPIIQTNLQTKRILKRARKKNSTAQNFEPEPPKPVTPLPSPTPTTPVVPQPADVGGSRPRRENDSQFAIQPTKRGWLDPYTEILSAIPRPEWLVGVSPLKFHAALEASLLASYSELYTLENGKANTVKIRQTLKNKLKTIEGQEAIADLWEQAQSLATSEKTELDAFAGSIKQQRQSDRPMSARERTRQAGIEWLKSKQEKTYAS